MDMKLLKAMWPCKGDIRVGQNEPGFQADFSELSEDYGIVPAPGTLAKVQQPGSHPRLAGAGEA